MKTTLLSGVLVFVILLSLGCATDRGTVRYGQGGQITSGTGIAYCEEPRKSYTSEIDAAVKAAIKSANSSNYTEVGAQLKNEIVKLTDYSQKGLDLDLVLFRVCEMSINRGFTSEQTKELIKETIQIWNKPNVQNLNLTDPDLEKFASMIAKNLRPSLEKKYQENYTVIGLNKDGSIVPKGLVPEGIDVSWNTGKVKFLDQTLEITIPDIEFNTKHFKNGRLSSNTVKIPNRVDNHIYKLFSFGPDFSVELQVLGIDKDQVVIGLGFPPLNGR